MTKRAGLAGYVVCFGFGLAVGSLGFPSTTAAWSQASPRAQADAPEEVAILRYLRIKKGSFPDVYRLSAEGVWPYYERAGVRIVGMWQVTYPALPGQTRSESDEYDEAYLLTRYASVEHWQATRAGAIERFGGSGPDLLRMRESLTRRQALTAKSDIVVLRGRPALNGPFFHPAIAK